MTHRIGDWGGHVGSLNKDGIQFVAEKCLMFCPVLHSDDVSVLLFLLLFVLCIFWGEGLFSEPLNKRVER